MASPGRVGHRALNPRRATQSSRHVRAEVGVPTIIATLESPCPDSNTAATSHGRRPLSSLLDLCHCHTDAKCAYSSSTLKYTFLCLFLRKNRMEFLPLCSYIRACCFSQARHRLHRVAHCKHMHDMIGAALKNMTLEVSYRRPALKHRATSPAPSKYVQQPTNKVLSIGGLNARGARGVVSYCPLQPCSL